MFRIITLISLLLINPFNIITAQPWYYDFGTEERVYNSQGQSNTFLPSPENGTALVAIGTGGGLFSMENSSMGFGEGSILRMVAPTTDSSNINKFSIINVDPGTAFTINFDLRIAGENSGVFHFYLGFNQGSSQTFTGIGSGRGIHVFSGLRWELRPDDSVASFYRSVTTWVPLAQGTFAKDINYRIEIYANNSVETGNYFNNGLQSVAPRKWDLWVNKSLIGDDLGIALLSDTAGLNSFTFHGEGSIANTGMIYLDNIYYLNQLAAEPLPVETMDAPVSDYMLFQNYPNPFNPDTRIRFTLPAHGMVKLSVYNILGENVAELVNDYLGQGVHQVDFNSSDLPSGIYMYRLDVENHFSEMRKMILLK